MEKLIQEYFERLRFDRIKTHKNLSVVPLFEERNHSPAYQTLKEALARGSLTIGEIDVGGSVPELKVINKGDIPVLLLDGEELSGAKQNRVLNTTILIDSHSEIVVPVSCTEQGRWSYTSQHFGDSNTVMASCIRSEKAQHVNENLRAGRSYRSDQGAVWRSIEKMSVDAKVHSPTGAMRDVFREKEDELDEYIQALTCEPGQKGIIVFIDGKIVGFDCLSLEPAYASLHDKLLKSYAMEAILLKKRKQVEPSTETAKTFVGQTTTCEETKYKSVGLGWDYRYEAPRLVGSALEFDGHVIHTAFFPIKQSDKIDPMAGYHRRRAYRTQNGGTV
jgi:hypothetical protein